MPKQQLPGQGVTDQQQEALTHLGKMMGPQSDSFDDEVQALHDKRHAAEHEATDYEKEFAEFPHEKGYAKMRAAQTGGSEGLGPTEAESALAKQKAVLQQQAAGAGQAQAAQAQGQMSPQATPPPAPTGGAGVSTPYSSQAGAVGGSGQAPPGTQGGSPPEAPAQGGEGEQGPPAE